MSSRQDRLIRQRARRAGTPVPDRKGEAIAPAPMPVDPTPHLLELGFRPGPSGVLLGPDGRPLLKPVLEDRTLTYHKEGDPAPTTLNPLEVLMRAARMQRDGMTLDNIRAELDLVGDIPDALLQAALNEGHALLEAAIRDGREPEESKNVVGYELVEAGNG